MDGNPVLPVPYMTKGERRGGRVLINSGYRYIRSRSVRERAIYWRCARSTCRETLVTNFFDVALDEPADIEIIRGGFQEHTHEPDFNIVERRQFVEEALDVIRQNPSVTIKRAYDIVVSRGDYDLAEIPAFKGIKSQLQRLRKALFSPQDGHFIKHKKEPIQCHPQQQIGQAMRRRQLNTCKSRSFNRSRFVTVASGSSSSGHHPIMEEVEIKPKILNKPQSALDLAIALQRCILKMKAACMAEDGSGIDYSKLRQSDLYIEYQSKARELQIIDLRPLTSDQRKAFFINIYNALTIDALAAQPELPSTILDVQDFWKSSSYVIAGQVYSLDDIEHGILRKNKPHPSTEKSCFHGNDPRLPYMVDSLDARIHFALNCGAESCPPISVYTEQNLDRALHMASENYLSQEVTVDTEAKQINLPSLLKWYGSDAAPTDVEVVRWTIPFLEGEKAAQVQELIAAMETGSEVAIGYRPYSWKVNSINVGDV